MRRVLIRFFIAWAIILGTSYTKSDGNLAPYPPLPKDIFVRTGEDGMPKLEPIEIELQTAKYYRLNIR